MPRRWERNRKCSIEGFGNPHLSKDYCYEHYWNWKLRGDPLKGPTKAPDGAPIRFVKKALRHRSSECLIYPYGKDSNGYANIWFHGVCTRVHVLVCELAHGKAPRGKPFALHGECGNPECVNPKHLYWGSQKSNMADAIRHGTTTRGSKSASALVVEDQVRDIRKLLGIVPQREIAERFGIHQTTVSNIATGATWAWLDAETLDRGESR